MATKKVVAKETRTKAGAKAKVKAKAKAKVKAKVKAKASASAKGKAKTAKRKPAPQTFPGIRAWVVKSEPFVYSFDQLIHDGKTGWDGVRNYEARNALRAMKEGDTLLYYHSNEGKEIVGIAKVAKEAYQDPTTDEDWSAVEIAPVKKLAQPIGLPALKKHKSLSKMALVKKGRISVTPVTKAELDAVLALSNTTL